MRLAKQWHPDRNPDHPERAKQIFQQILASYEILSNQVERKRYDRSRTKRADASNFWFQDTPSEGREAIGSSNSFFLVRYWRYFRSLDADRRAGVVLFFLSLSVAAGFKILANNEGVIDGIFGAVLILVICVLFMWLWLLALLYAVATNWEKGALQHAVNGPDFSSRFLYWLLGRRYARWHQKQHDIYNPPAGIRRVMRWLNKLC